MTNVVEIVVYTVTDVEAGMQASLGVVEESRGISDGILDAQTYQSVNNPEQIVVRVVWSSLEEAERVANWVFENSPSYKALGEVTQDQMLFDHFREV
jgi:heme-degrading monooxygenase HmoA